MSISIDEIAGKLSRGWLEDVETLDKKFDELARIFLEEVAIRKGKALYIPREIEFYLYSNNHRDIITYPRSCNAGDWFFHASGVDISFESYVEYRDSKGRTKPYLTDKAFFGGILIRAVAKLDKSGQTIEKEFFGPQIVVNELFDKFTALSCPTNFPILVPYSHSFGKAHLYKDGSRHNLLPKGKLVEDKVKVIKSHYCDIDISNENLTESFADFITAKYRYTSLH